jgi:uncharacterized membrane protein (UPF0127 family)
MKNVWVNNLSNPQAVKLKLGICDNFSTRLKGLMFSKYISFDGGLFFLNSYEDRTNSAIHMFFMNYDLTIIWVNSSGTIVDRTIATRWKTIARPCSPAKYILEAHPDRFCDYRIGDSLEFNYG